MEKEPVSYFTAQPKKPKKNVKNRPTNCILQLIHTPVFSPVNDPFFVYASKIRSAIDGTFVADVSHILFLDITNTRLRAQVCILKGECNV